MSKHSINNVLKLIKGVFKTPKKPLSPLPPPLILTGAGLRTGLNVQDIVSRILSRQSEAGAPVGDIFSENGNISEMMETIRVQEIISALQLESKIEIVLPPGIQVTTVGVGNAGVPVISNGATTLMATGHGIIR